MTPEGAVRSHLRKTAIAAGFNHRKVRWIGYRNCPDEFVFGHGTSAFIEVKRPGEPATDAQVREHVRLRAAGLRVFVVDSRLSVELTLSLMLGSTNRLTDGGDCGMLRG